MKRILITLVCFCSLSACLAQTNSVPMQLQDVPEWQGPRKIPPQLPSVSYDDTGLYIVSPYYIEEAQVIIRDEQGTCLYSNSASLPLATLVMLSLPSSILNDMYSVELLYDSIHLIGYF